LETETALDQVTLELAVPAVQLHQVQVFSPPALLPQAHSLVPLLLAAEDLASVAKTAIPETIKDINTSNAKALSLQGHHQEAQVSHSQVLAPSHFPSLSPQEPFPALSPPAAADSASLELAE
jgi:hypothetical protein